MSIISKCFQRSEVVMATGLLLSWTGSQSRQEGCDPQPGPTTPWEEVQPPLLGFREVRVNDIIATCAGATCGGSSPCSSRWVLTRGSTTWGLASGLLID